MQFYASVAVSPSVPLFKFEFFNLQNKKFIASISIAVFSNAELSNGAEKVRIFISKLAMCILCVWTDLVKIAAPRREPTTKMEWDYLQEHVMTGQGKKWLQTEIE